MCRWFDPGTRYSIILSAMAPIPYSMAVGSWLPHSETFIYDQIVRAERYLPSVLARDLVPSRSAFPFERVTALSSPQLFAYYAFYRAPRFERALRESGARFIHAHFGTNGALIAPTAKRLGLPLVTTLHGIDIGVLLGRVPPQYWFYKRSYRQMLEVSNLLLPASQELAERLVDLGADPGKIQVHRLGVDLSTLQYVARPSRAARFLMIGRMVEKKGFEYGLRAFAQAKEKMTGSTITLVGDGPLLEPLKELSLDLGIGQQVEFTGSLPRYLVHQRLLESDVLLAPSVVAGNNDRDSGLIVLKEAGATGMASIGTYCGGLPEIIDDGTTGYLVPQRSVASMAEAMVTLANDESLRQRMGVEARQKMEREYDAVEQNRILERHFDSLL